MPSWFDTARFGVFVHWGHSSQRGCELSWPMVGGSPALPHCQALPVEEYQATVRTFDPRSFDPGAWARLFREVGAGYAVLTAKHHDGFAMFHTRQSDFSVEHSPSGRDIVREFVEAMRDEGLRVGLYFSLIDWRHPDYPPFADEHRPYLFGRRPQPTSEQWARYVGFMFAQVRELLTNYGQIDIIWFDGHWERTPEQWKARELREMIRSLQPDTLVNDRLPGCGDFDTPEQVVPASSTSHDRPWEVCMTMNESWGYNPADDAYKSSRQLVHTLCETAGRGGRLLLNVSPTGEGVIPPEQVERLQAVGAWMERNGEAIWGSESGLEPWQFYGPSTRRGERLYLHLLMRPYDSLTVRGIRTKRVKSAQLLGSGRSLAFTTRCAIIDSLLNSDPLGEATIQVPEDALDPLATVIALDFAGEPA